MNLDRIKEFYHIAKLENITKASRELNVSQPALSRSMQLFEQHLGVLLFVRCPRGMKLTLEGERVYEFARRIIEEASLLGKTIKANHMEGELTIAASPYLGGTWLLKKLKGYLQLHTEIRLKLLERADPPKAGEVDAMVGFEVPDTSDFVKHVLFRSPLGLFASPVYLEKNGAPESLEDLDGHALISYSEPPRAPYKDKDPWILALCKSCGGYKTPYLRTPSLEGLMTAACEGFGVTELPRDLAEIKERGLIPVLPHLQGPEVEFAFAYPQQLKHRAAVRALRDYLAEDGLI